MLTVCWGQTCCSGTAWVLLSWKRTRKRTTTTTRKKTSTMTSRTTTDQPESTASEPRGRTPARRSPLASRAWSMVEGRVIDNAISGERIVIRKSGAQTGGRVLAFDLFLPPGGHVPARHVHPVQEERFTVVTGRMRFRLGRSTIVAAAGDTVLVPAGTAHWFGNAGGGAAPPPGGGAPAPRTEGPVH